MRPPNQLLTDIVVDQQYKQFPFSSTDFKIFFQFLGLQYSDYCQLVMHLYYLWSHAAYMRPRFPSNSDMFQTAQNSMTETKVKELLRV
jgi:hypothetical protein